MVARFQSVGWSLYAITPRQIREQRAETIEFVRSRVWKRNRGKPIAARAEADGGPPSRAAIGALLEEL